MAEETIPTREDVISYLHERRNWGRWGEDDQLGALNLITDEKRQRAAGLVKSGRAVSLSRDVPTIPGPTSGTCVRVAGSGGAKQRIRPPCSTVRNACSRAAGAALPTTTRSASTPPLAARNRSGTSSEAWNAASAPRRSAACSR